MVKRILALHGVGSSTETLKAQMSALVAELGPDYDFTYLDGAIERERGPGMLPNSHGPFYSYTTGYSPAEIRDALDDIDDFVEEYGPFDGIVAFSQGGGFAASYILDHQWRSADGRPPFNFAILLSPAAAFSADESCNVAVIEELLGSDYAANNFADMEITQLSPKGRLLADYMGTTFGLAKKLNVAEGCFDLHRDVTQQEVPRIVHPALTATRIRIPVVHFTGKLDWPEMNVQCNMVRKLCDQSMLQSFEHDGAHAVPYKKADVLKLAKAIEWAIAESEYQMIK